MYASTARASFWRRRRSRSKRSVASRVSARLRQFERRFTGASARRPRSIAPSSATSRRPVDPSYPEGRRFSSPRPVDLGDEIEEAGKVSELTVEAQGGITVNTNTKDGDSGA